MGISMEAVISGDERVKVEQPLLCWANSVESDEEVRNILKILLRAYRLTNDCYDKRFEGTKREDKLTKYLKVVDDYSPLCNEHNDVERMKGVVKANILLRRGQVKADSFVDPTDDYQRACVILEQLYRQREPENADFLEFLIQLNLGKYFRNMGMYMHRSDYYWRAHDEFKDILDKLVKIQKNNHGEQSWTAFIWLEASMNLSRSELYLYNLKNAKIHLWNIYQKTACEIIKADSCIKDIFLGYEKVDGKSPLFPPQLLAPILGIDERDSLCKANSKILQDYAVQALLQLGIAFRKTRDYAIAREIFATIILQDQGKNDINVDALNNYVVCLRKSGFSIKDPTEVEKRFIEIIEQAVSKKKEKSSMIFDWNTESIKKLYFAILSCVMKGKNTELDIKEEYCSNSGIVEISHKNRFATMEFIRSYLWEGNEKNDHKNIIGKLIKNLLKNNPGDREVVLQKGLFLQRNKQYQPSSDIFCKLYLEYPQIAKGTIALKAYYNMGCNFLAEHKYYEAKEVFEKIIKEIKVRQSPTSESTLPICLKDLPSIDLLSEIDEAWCLMNIGKYEDAKLIYEELILLYQNQIDRLGNYNMKRVHNNLLECCLQLLAAYKEGRDKQDEQCQSLKKTINNCLGFFDNHDSHNKTAIRLRAYFHLVLGKTESMDSIKKYQEAMKLFEMLELHRCDDVYLHSGWVSSAYEWYLEAIKFEKCEKVNFEVLESVKKRIRYISGPYSIKSCAKLSEMLVFLISKGICTENEESVLYRAIARIRLSENEEGIGHIKSLQDNTVFCRLDSLERGKVLVILFQVLWNILEIKELCRYYPGKSEPPVHYRTFEHLQRYLGEKVEEPRNFTLWNVAYMNDYLEGASFSKMLMFGNRRIYRNLIKEKDKVALSFVEKNTYTASFSQKRDAIPMWIAYGDNGKGCALTYSEKFFNLRYGKDYLSDVACYSDDDYPLYRVQYIDSKMNGSNECKETINKIKQYLKKIMDLLVILQCCMDKIIKQHKNSPGIFNEDGFKSVIGEFIVGVFDEVRYLIKDIEYASEEEIRMIHYSKENKVSNKENMIPRCYIENNREVILEEVRIGPKVDKFEETEILTWLYKTGKVKSVSRSERHYH